jgi:hypothetical protein
MFYSISANGDPIEVENSVLIMSIFPAYNDLWGTYIGNNGASDPVRFVNENEDEYTSRKLFSQRSYTVLISVLCLDRIIKKFPEINWVEMKKTDRILELTNQVMVFFAHIGRIRDALLYMLQSLQMDESPIRIEFDELWKSRSIALHKAQFPYYFPDGIPSIPDFSEPASKITWADGFYYKDLDKHSFNYVEDVFISTFQECLKLTNQIYYSIHSRVNEVMSKKGFQFSNADRIINDKSDPGTSSFCPNS